MDIQATFLNGERDFRPSKKMGEFVLIMVLPEKITPMSFDRLEIVRRSFKIKTESW